MWLAECRFASFHLLYNFFDGENGLLDPRDEDLVEFFLLWIS